MANRSQPMKDQELDQYIREREAAQAKLIDPHSEFRKQSRMSDIQNHKYNVHRWRG